jgi:NTP pyrophosphatase (non-canonical NTP hydrolase)
MTGRRLHTRWPSPEEVAELEAAVRAGEQSAMDEELGEVLLAAVNVGRF